MKSFLPIANLRKWGREFFLTQPGDAPGSRIRRNHFDGERALLPLFPTQEGGEGRGEEALSFWSAPLSGSLPTRSSRGERGAGGIAGLFGSRHVIGEFNFSGAWSLEFGAFPHE
jgi:hypothetical protein